MSPQGRKNEHDKIDRDRVPIILEELKDTIALFFLLLLFFLPQQVLEVRQKEDADEDHADETGVCREQETREDDRECRIDDSEQEDITFLALQPIVGEEMFKDHNCSFPALLTI